MNANKNANQTRLLFIYLLNSIYHNQNEYECRRISIENPICVELDSLGLAFFVNFFIFSGTFIIIQSLGTSLSLLLLLNFIGAYCTSNTDNLRNMFFTTGWIE